MAAWRQYARLARSLIIAGAHLRTATTMVQWTEELRPLQHYLARRAVMAGRLSYALTTEIRSDGSDPVERLAAVVRQKLDEQRRGIAPAFWNDLEPLDLMQAVIDIVNEEWISASGVGPRVMLDSASSPPFSSRLVISSSWSLAPRFPLFGKLAMQLAFVVGMGKGVAFCAECGTAFEPGRRLPPGRNHYCGKLCKVRFQVRASRLRKQRPATSGGRGSQRRKV